MQMEKSLMNQKLMQMPAIFIQPDVDKTLSSKLKDIIKRHQGSVVDREDDASHIIYALPTNQPPEGQFWSNFICLPSCAIAGIGQCFFTDELADVKIVLSQLATLCVFCLYHCLSASVFVYPSVCFCVMFHCLFVFVFVSLLQYSVWLPHSVSVSVCPSFLIPSCPDLTKLVNCQWKKTTTPKPNYPPPTPIPSLLLSL